MKTPDEHRGGPGPARHRTAVDAGWLLSMWQRLLLPELQGFAPADRVEAMLAACETPFDRIEWIGLACGVAAVINLTSLAATQPDLVRVAVGLTMLALVVGPFHVRRVRRGLRLRLAQLSC